MNAANQLRVANAERYAQLNENYRRIQEKKQQLEQARTNNNNALKSSAGPEKVQAIQKKNELDSAERKLNDEEALVRELVELNGRSVDEGKQITSTRTVTPAEEPAPVPASPNFDAGNNTPGPSPADASPAAPAPAGPDAWDGVPPPSVLGPNDIKDQSIPTNVAKGIGEIPSSTPETLIDNLGESFRNADSPEKRRQILNEVLDKPRLTSALRSYAPELLESLKTESGNPLLNENLANTGLRSFIRDVPIADIPAAPPDPPTTSTPSTGSLISDPTPSDPPVDPSTAAGTSPDSADYSSNGRGSYNPNRVGIFGGFFQRFFGRFGRR